MNITSSGEQEKKSDWTLPEQGEPAFVQDGVLRPEHYQKRPFVQIWAEKSAWCDHVVDNKGTVLSGSYWNPTKREPIVVLPWSTVPVIPDRSNPSGFSVWPASAFSLKGQKGLEVDLFLQGDFPSEVLNMTDCTDCRARVHLFGSAAHLWTMKGGVDLERCSGCSVEVFSGTYASSTIVRNLGSENSDITVHSGCKSLGHNLDTGRVYDEPRHTVNGVQQWSDGGSRIRVHTGDAFDQVASWLNRFNVPFKRADVMLDDFGHGNNVSVYGEGGSAYVSGPDNVIEADFVTLDPRSGKEWGTMKSQVPWKADLGGNQVSAKTVVV